MSPAPLVTGHCPSLTLISLIAKIITRAGLKIQLSGPKKQQEKRLSSQGHHEAFGGSPARTYPPKKKGAKNFDPQSSQIVGGSAWESNPPTAFSRRHTGFEVR